MKNIITNYVKGSMQEMSKVTWPTKNQAIRMTIIVLVFCIFFALFLGVTDYLFNLLHSYLINAS